MRTSRIFSADLPLSLNDLTSWASRSLLTMTEHIYNTVIWLFIWVLLGTCVTHYSYISSCLMIQCTQCLSGMEQWNEIAGIHIPQFSNFIHGVSTEMDLGRILNPGYVHMFNSAYDNTRIIIESISNGLSCLNAPILYAMPDIILPHLQSGIKDNSTAAEPKSLRVVGRGTGGLPTCCEQQPVQEYGGLPHAVNSSHLPPSVSMRVRVVYPHAVNSSPHRPTSA